MSSFKVFLAIGAIAVATFLVADVTPASADPTGTTFSFASNNFQGDGGDPAVPFGVPTSIPGSGVTVDSMVSTSSFYPSPIPGDPDPLLIGGLEFLEFWISSDDSGFLNEAIPDQSQWIISGLNWGPGSEAAVATRIVWLTFSADGVPVPLDGTLLGIQIAPHPITGADAIPIDIAGAPVETGTFFDTLSLTGAPLFVTLGLLGLSNPDALAVDAMHVGLEIIHVPEPATLALAGLGLCSTLLIRRRKR